MSVANILLISAPKQMNAAMVWADLFEKGKVLGIQTWLEVKYEPAIQLTLEQAFKVVQALGHQDIDKLIVSLVHLVSIEADNTVIWNNGQIAPYWNPEVRMVSSGKAYFMLDEFVRSLGFQVTTNDQRYITAIT